RRSIGRGGIRARAGGRVARAGEVAGIARGARDHGAFVLGATAGRGGRRSRTPAPSSAPVASATEDSEGDEEGQDGPTLARVAQGILCMRWKTLASDERIAVLPRVPACTPSRPSPYAPPQCSPCYKSGTRHHRERHGRRRSILRATMSATKAPHLGAIAVE